MAIKRAASSSLAVKAKKKETGAHFTPSDLAMFIAERLLTYADSSRPTLRVLDPSCGDGELLLSLYRALPATKRHAAELIGMDVDGEAVEEAGRRLAGVETKVSLETGDFLEAAVMLGEQPNLWPASPRSLTEVDMVIANPPYVRTQVLGASKAQALGSTFGLSGRVDLYHAFLAAMTMALRPGGLLGVITSNRYLTTRGGSAIRRFLADEFEILELVDLGDTKLFEAAVLPALFFGRRRARHTARGRSKTKFVRIYEAESLLSSGAETRNVESILSAVRDGNTSTYVVEEKRYSVSSGEIEIASECGSGLRSSLRIVMSSRGKPAYARRSRWLAYFRVLGHVSGPSARSSCPSDG